MMTVLQGREASAQESSDASTATAQRPSLTVDQIVNQLEERDRERATALRKFQGTRIYSVQYRGFFGARNAEAVVNFNYASPSDRDFAIVSESGSKILIDHVIKGLMDGEKEAATDENRERWALNTKNYEFSLADEDTAGEASQYVLNVVPRNDSKFLYRGKIWVDAKDFAVSRIEAEPAKNPSFWLKKCEVHHEYEKIGNFWLPAQNQSQSWIRLGGRAVLSIDYKDYKIIETTPLEPAETARTDSDVSAAGLSKTALH